MMIRLLLLPTRGRIVAVSLSFLSFLAVPVRGQVDTTRVYLSTEVDRVPERLFCPGARLPGSLTQKYDEAEVTVGLIVGSDGRAEGGSVEAFSVTDQAFEEPARDMIYECLFEPGVLDGKTVRVRLVMPIRWSFLDRRIPTVDLDSVDLGRTFTLADSAGGYPIVTKAPKLLTCPRYDPQERPNRARIDDRYEREQQFERAPLNIEALIEIVIGTDGKVKNNEIRVLRTNDHRADKRIMQWVQSCIFEPGMVGDKNVTVRIEFPVKYQFVRGP